MKNGNFVSSIYGVVISNRFDKLEMLLLLPNALAHKTVLCVVLAIKYDTDTDKYLP